jgi:hypothetical protein
VEHDLDAARPAAAAAYGGDVDDAARMSARRMESSIGVLDICRGLVCA